MKRTATAAALCLVFLASAGAPSEELRVQEVKSGKLELCGRISRLERNALWVGKTLVVITPRTEVRQGRLPLAAARLQRGETVVVRGVWVRPGTLRAVRVMVLPE